MTDSVNWPVRSGGGTVTLHVKVVAFTLVAALLAIVAPFWRTMVHVKLLSRESPRKTTCVVERVIVDAIPAAKVAETLAVGQLEEL